MDRQWPRSARSRSRRAIGISSSSLYQYCRNKAALVAALLEKYAEDLTWLCLSELTPVGRLVMGEALRSTIELMIRAHAVELELHHVRCLDLPSPYVAHHA